MGFLVNVKSSPDFVLQREDFPKALRGLKGLAKELPNEFDLDAAASVARAKSLKDALSNAYWAPRFDEYGDLIGIDYEIDKAPSNATDVWPILLLEVLAKAGATGGVRFKTDADDQVTSFFLDKDGVSRSRYAEASSFALRAVGDVPKSIEPGKSVVLELEGGDLLGDKPLTVKLTNDWSPTSWGAWGTPTNLSANLDCAPMRAGERRKLALSAQPDSRGSVQIGLATGDHSESWTLVIAPTPEDLAARWVVIDRKSKADRSTLVGKSATKKVHELLRRFAVRNAARPGAAFLNDVASSGSLDQALAVAGLTLREAEKRQQELAFVADRLPGAEPIFAEFLNLLANHAALHCHASLSLAFDHFPGIWRQYQVHYGTMERGTMPRAT